MTTIRVRVNPADADEYAIYADVDDRDGQWWLGQRSGGRWTGWEYNERVADWPEFKLTIPVTEQLTERREGRGAELPGPSARSPGGPSCC